MQCYFITPAVDILYGTLFARGLADYGTEGVLVVPDVFGRLALLEEQQGHNQFSCPQRLQDDHGRSNMAGIADSLDWTCSTRLNTNSRFPDPKANGILRGWETVRIADITDGTTKTLLVGEVTGAGPGTCQGFRWSAHGIMDVAGGINGAGSLPGNGQYLGKNGTFSSYHPGGCHFALADGSARFLSQDIDQLTLQSLAGRNDGAIVEGY